MFEISEALREAVKQHAIEAFPAEACGFIMEEDYVWVENASADPENHFRVVASDFITYKDARAFIHSHPEAGAFALRNRRPGFYPFCPSGADMQSQMATSMTFGIVVTDGEHAADPFFWGDFLLDEPIYGRPFRHGVEDCYTIIRKWFWQEKGVKLPDFARDPDWWNTDQNLYLNNFPGVGFRRLGNDEPLQAGDCGLIQLGTAAVKAINHAFIYLGDGTICHHVPNRLSSREAMGGRLREQKLWLRYTGLAASVSSTETT